MIISRTYALLDINGKGLSSLKMEQFKFTKNENKEDFTETAVFEARKECFPHYVARGSSGHVFSQSSEEASHSTPIYLYLYLYSLFPGKTARSGNYCIVS